MVNILIAILGGFIGGWLLPKLGIHIGSGYVGLILTSVLGALAILLLVNTLKKAQ